MCSQVLHIVLVPAINSENKCTASTDSFSDYRQFTVFQSGMGHIMYSAATAWSTMDYSVMPVDDSVVDSPPNGGKRTNPMSSPYPLKCRRRSTSLQDLFGMNAETQRKLYDEHVGVLPSLEVWRFPFYDLAMELEFVNGIGFQISDFNGLGRAVILWLSLVTLSAMLHLICRL